MGKDISIPEDIIKETLSLLKEAAQSYPTRSTRCHGDKCREQWCRSCYPDEDVDEYLEIARKKTSECLS